MKPNSFSSSSSSSALLSRYLFIYFGSFRYLGLISSSSFSLSKSSISTSFFLRAPTSASSIEALIFNFFSFVKVISSKTISVISSFFLLSISLSISFSIWALFFLMVFLLSLLVFLVPTLSSSSPSSSSSSSSSSSPSISISSSPSSSSTSSTSPSWSSPSISSTSSASSSPSTISSSCSSNSRSTNFRSFAIICLTNRSTPAIPEAGLFWA
mmetsp:Transcript_46499/g.53607  ORF Transcript_46499/g.53607 Transcript_46499/m.53607 type:complete len:212 (+) Transcript_46499:436-1071(+)